MRKIIFAIVFSVFLFGCASLQEAMNGVTSEQHSIMTTQVSAVTQPYIPKPYQIPASLIIGWVACVGYNWFKIKTSK